ncbi:MAG TPA: amidohydrolase family protein [Myxococcales bacterium]|nr:amidohydrolase family protein [Myxococcales bacterium]
MRRLAILLLAGCTAATAPKPSKKYDEQLMPALTSRSWTQQRPVVIRHALVMPVSGPSIQDGAVSFEGGKIVAVGPDAQVQTPPQGEEIDARGMVVTPGIIDAHSHLGVYASPQSTATSDGNEATNPVTSEVSAKDGFWPQDPGLRRAAAGGITSLLILPGSANLIGGRGFPVKLHFGRTADEMRFPGAKDGLKMACGENPKRVYGTGQHKAPSTRMGNIAETRKAWAAARDYMNKFDQWRNKGMTEPPPARDLRLETLVGVLKGEILVQNHCYRADELQLMIDMSHEFGYHIRAFHHAVEAYKLRDVLAKEDIGVATWADWWGGKLELWDAIPQNIGLLQEAGVHAHMHSDSQDGIQRLNQEAGKALAAARAMGLKISDDEAMRWLTINPAWIMGTDGVTGSLEAGKMADIVIWDRNPFSVYSRAQRVYADGVVTYDVKTGASVLSDFELGEPLKTAALQTPKAAEVPQFKPASTELLPVAAADCTVIRNAIGLDGKPMPELTLRGGQIAKAGAGCKEVDAQGHVLAPGFIDPSDQLGLVEVSLEETANDAQWKRGEKHEPIHAAIRASDDLDEFSQLLPVARTGGITSSVSVPGGGVVSGQAAWFAMDGTVLKAPLAVGVRLGLQAKEELGGPRAAGISLLRELLEDAKEFGAHKKDYDQNKSRRFVASGADLEALQPVLAGKLPLLVQANRVSDLRAVLALAKEHKLKVIFSGAAEGWLMASELAGIPVILDAREDLPANFDAIASRQDNAALLAAAGAKVMFAPMGDAHFARTLPQAAGNAVAFGLPYNEAIKGLTSNVAEAFGLNTGKLADGLRGDVVLWSGDPLETSSRPVAMWIGGKQVPLTNRQTALFQKYRTIP